MNSQQIWDHIDSHQEDSTDQLKKDLNLPNDVIMPVVMAWAIGDRTRFDNKLKSYENDKQNLHS